MNRTTIILITVVVLLVGAVGVLAGYNIQLQSQQPVIIQNNTTPSQTVQNNTTQTTESVSTDSNSDSQWMAKTCRGCGKTFYVPVNGEQMNYCDDCLRNMGYNVR